MIYVKIAKAMPVACNNNSTSKFKEKKIVSLGRFHGWYHILAGLARINDNANS